MITIQIFFPGVVWTRFNVVRLIRPPEAEKVGETSKSDEVSPAIRRTIRMKGTRGGSSRAMKS